MRKLIVAAMISLDGVMQAPGGPEEDPCGVFARPFERVLGRRTYDIFAAYWPHVPSDASYGNIADLFNGATKHVATHHPDTLAWQNSRALGPDVAAALRELKRGDGADLVTQGSSELLRQLLATDLVDELRLLAYPILLGRSKRTFDERTQASAFRLAASKAASSGVLITRYVRAGAGAVRTGSFEPD